MHGKKAELRADFTTTLWVIRQVMVHKERESVLQRERGHDWLCARVRARQE